MLAEAKKPPMMQSSMVQGMVERLAERLKKDGSDLNGWVRLVHSYKVMGETDKQNAAIADAKRAFANDPAKLKQLEAALEAAERPAAAPAAAGSMPPKRAAQAATTGQHEGATISTMVESLHKKLKKSGDDPAGWLMLTRSYLTLQQKDKAKEAIAEARDALAASPDKLQQFEAALKHYKIDAPK